MISGLGLGLGLETSGLGLEALGLGVETPGLVNVPGLHHRTEYGRNISADKSYKLLCRPTRQCRVQKYSESSGSLSLRS